MTVSVSTRRLLDSATIVDLLVPDVPAPILPGVGRLFEEHVARFERSGVTFASFTVGLDHLASVEGQIKGLGAVRRWFLTRPERFVLVRTVADIAEAKRSGRLAVNFHFQGTNALMGDLNLVEVYRMLGVGHMLMAYNEKNLVGDGCHERTDCGLSAFGIRLVEEMNRVGVAVDVSHTGYRTSMDVFEVAKAPVIFSHANPRGLYAHERNVRDDQIQACAKTGGVIGVTGVGLFMSKDGLDISTEMLVRQIDYIAELVGAKHIGFGLDHIEDVAHLIALIDANAGRYPESGGYNAPKLLFASPEIIPDIAEKLLAKNWTEADVRGVLGENWLRVLGQVWG
ncbi:MAG TPA: membrane dipeptidase [Caulobacteraceae bacterium]|jgi:membrane dipeptidase|nr:membrane dipeptidase [Caulobacteraceae bacterium]